MKKVGIVTFHMAFNHGAMLQAYGLSKKLNTMGVDAEIIDYRLPFIDRYHHRDGLQEFWDKEKIVGVLKYIKRYIGGKYYSPSWKKFNYFMTKKLPLSEQVFDADFSNLNYDCYITGSDQVWNGDLTGGIQACYFLESVQDSAKRVAYAASCGGKDFGNSDIKQIKEWLKNFNAIGIREESLTSYVSNILGIEATTVLDPTLILGKEKWMELVHDVPEKKYVLIYTFDEKPYIYEMAREYAQKKGLRLIAMAYEKKDIGEDIFQLFDQGPEDFVSYIYHADAIFTSSFHGTAFSIIFEKQFYCFPHPKYHERTDNLLNIAGLLDRYVYEGERLNDSLINYRIVAENMFSAINDSEKFLIDNVVN